MIFRQLTSGGDWLFGQGISGYATDEKAIELNVRTRLLSWKGNWFQGLNDFVDWLSRLDKGQEANLSQEIQNVILQSFGVVSIKNFVASLDRTTRAYRAEMTIETIFGTTFSVTLDQASGIPAGS